MMKISYWLSLTAAVQTAPVASTNATTLVIPTPAIAPTNEVITPRTNAPAKKKTAAKPAAKKPVAKKPVAKKPDAASMVRSEPLVPGPATVIASNVNVRGQ